MNQNSSTPRIERWESSEGRTEIHYFRTKDDEYLFGYNPLLIDEKLLSSLIEWAEKQE